MPADDHERTLTLQMHPAGTAAVMRTVIRKELIPRNKQVVYCAVLLYNQTTYVRTLFFVRVNAGNVKTDSCMYAEDVLKPGMGVFRFCVYWVLFILS